MICINGLNIFQRLKEVFESYKKTLEEPQIHFPKWDKTLGRKMLVWHNSKLWDSVDKQNCRESKDANGYHGDVRERVEKDGISMVC